MIFKSFLSLLILMTTAMQNCKAQIDDFTDIFSTCIKNKVFTKKTTEIESERTFLGYITDSDKRVIYYVIKEHYSVQAAIVRHGHDRVLFFDKDKKLAGLYNLDDPDWLPYALGQNSLYFKYKQKNVERLHVVRIGKKLPVPLCVMPNKCFWPQKE